jgi:hypothetical protein
MSTEAININVVQENSAPSYGKITAIKSYQGVLVSLAVKSDQLNILEGKKPKEPTDILTIPRKIENPGSICKYNKEYFIVDSKKKLLYRMTEGGKKMKCELSLVTKGSDKALSLINSPGSTISDLDIKNDKLWFICSAGYSSTVCSFDLKTEKEEVYLNFDNIFLTRGARPNGILFIEEKNSIMVIDSFKCIITTYGTEGKSLNIYKGQFNKESRIKFGVNPEYVAKGLAIDENNNIWVLESKVENKRLIYR